MKYYNPYFIKYTIVAVSACLFMFVSSVFAVDKLDPYRADFRVVPDHNLEWKDIEVRLDFQIHNSNEGKLAGSKFLCLEKIDSIIITDGHGRRLPFTIKQYPRKRIIWEYGPAENGVRRVNISFRILGGMKKEGGNYLLNIDWVKWNRKVLNAQLNIILPVAENNFKIISSLPAYHKILANRDFSTVVYEFSELNAKVLKLVVKSVEKKKKESAKKVAAFRPLLKNVRIAPHSKTCDRLVLEFDRKISFNINDDQDKKMVEILFSSPISVSDSVAEKNNIKSRFIKGVYWKKTKNKKLSCMVSLKAGDMRVRYGMLNNPHRAYIDICSNKPGVSIKKKESSKKNKTDMKNPKKVLQVKVKRRNIKETPLNPSKTDYQTTTFSSDSEKKIPIEQRINYRNAAKLYSTGEHEKALYAYEDFLRKYPETVLREEILFRLADILHQLAEKKDAKYFTAAIKAYKKALAQYHSSEKAEHAAYSIAECYRKNSFFLEAKGQYTHFAQKYRRSELVSAARFYIGECMYLLNRYAEALKEFEKFLDDFPADPHTKDAMLRVADCYYKKNDFDRAEYYYDKALKKWPDLSSLQLETLNNLGMALYYKGKFEKAREALLLSFNVYPEQDQRARILRFVGDSFQWDGEMQKALDVYEHVLVLYPDDLESMVSAMRIADLGVNVSSLKTTGFRFKGWVPYQEPEKVYRWIIEDDKSGNLMSEAFYKLGFILAKQGNYSEAVKQFKLAMYQNRKGTYYRKSIENVKKILVIMINDALENKDFFTVINLYQKNENPFLDGIRNCDLKYNVGKAYLELGFAEKAEKIFKAVLKTDNTDICRNRINVSMSQIDLMRGKYVKAEEKLSILLDDKQLEEPCRQEASYLLGDSCFLQQKYKECIEPYSSVSYYKDGSFRHALSLYRLGEALGATGYYYSGIQSLRQLLNINDDSARRSEELNIIKEDARMMIGDFFFKKNNFTNAIDAYQSLADESLNSRTKGWALLKTADVLLKTGDRTGASKVYSEIVDEMPYKFLGRFAREQIGRIEWNNSLHPELKQFL